MRLSDYLDKGASLGRSSPCLRTGTGVLSYADVQQISYTVGQSLHRSGVRPGDKVAVLSSNDPLSFASVFGISRAGAVWCPVNPRNQATENRDLLDAFDCTCLLFQAAYASLVAEILPQLPGIKTAVCLDGTVDFALTFDDWTAGIEPGPWELPAVDDTIMLVGTGGTTGRPKGVLLAEKNLETMTSVVLMSYPFSGRPVYLALAPLTHAAGVLCFPILALGGEIVILRKPDLGDFVSSVAEHRVTHTFLPPTLIYMLLGHPALPGADLTSLQCLWYGAAPMSAARLEEAIAAIGPVFGQLFGQTEAPMMISTMSPAEHLNADGSLALQRFSSAGHPSPLVTVAVMAEDGTLLPAGERGEVVVRSSLVMTGYYNNPEATEEAGRFGWHHTGDIGYLDRDNYLFLVDRAKDMIITGGFNVYSAEVEQALLAHPAVRDCAVIGLPDDKWGERVEAVVELHPGSEFEEPDVIAFVKARIGSVKAPKHVTVWDELPRTTVGKVAKAEIKARLRAGVS